MNETDPRTILLYDDLFLCHETGAHPESPDRLRWIVAHLKSAGIWEACRRVTPRDATVNEIESVHGKEYVQVLKEFAEDGGGQLDVDTVVSPRSYDAAVRAAGAALTACEEVLAGRARNAFCLVRPPGHHAMPGRGMGFCLLNNVAIAARQLVDRHGLERVAIVDWDVHHGNGTQAAFYSEPRVLYVSLHKYPFYPGTGPASEIGAGRAEGTTINVPIGWTTERGAYMAAFEQVVARACREFGPQFVLVSAGFDAHRDDPIAGLGLHVEDFARMTEIVCDLAQEQCGARVVSCLEGGYHPQELPRSAAAHVRVLLERSAVAPTGTNACPTD